jgi:hypothetical protein
LLLKKGDVAEGPGFGGVFAATAVKAAKGDSARHAVAAALVKVTRETVTRQIKVEQNKRE